MAVIDRSYKTKTINSTLGLTILVAGLVYVFILISHSSQLSGNISTALTEKGTFGPLYLFELSKQPVNSGGYQATIRFFSGGNIGYASLWALAGLLFAYIRLKHFRKT